MHLGDQSPENIQILRLAEQGADAATIAQCLNKDIAIVALILNQQKDAKRKLSLEERYGDLKDIAIKALMEVTQYGELESARVNAAKILLEEVDGVNQAVSNKVTFDYNELAQRLIIAQERVDAVKEMPKDKLLLIPQEYLDQSKSKLEKLVKVEKPKVEDIEFVMVENN